MRNGLVRLLALSVVLALLAGLAVSCSQDDTDNGGDGDNEPTGDVYALWKAQPDQSIVFKSTRDTRTTAGEEIYAANSDGATPWLWPASGRSSLPGTCGRWT